MALRIHRRANPPGTIARGQPSTTLGSACHEYRLLVGDDTYPVVTIKVVEFADEDNDLDNQRAGRLFDHFWKTVESDEKSNLILDLSRVRSVDPRFRRELAYLARQLRQQYRSVRLSGVSLAGDWESWL